MVRANLEGNLHANMQTVLGLVAVISLEPELTQERFQSISARLLGGHSHMKNIGASRGWVLSYIYPLEGNEKALGLDYRTIPGQYAGALRAKELGELVVAGPVNLKQGGQGFVGRFPVFFEAEGRRQFWGLVSAVIDIEQFYRSSGLFDETLNINLAIRGKDGHGEGGEVFYGDEALFNDNSVKVSVKLPAGEWVLAAEPKTGWSNQAENIFIFRLSELAVLLIAVLIGYIIVRLVERRNEQELRFRYLFDLSPLGIALNDFETGKFLEINNALLKPTGYTAEEFKALSYWDLTPRDYENDEAEQIRSLNNSGRYGPYEKKYIKKDGSQYPVQLNGVLVEDRNGHRYIWSIVEDISEREAAQKALLDSQYQLQRFFDLAVDFPCIFNLDGYFEKVSTSFSSTLGYSEDELKSKPFIEFVHPDDYSDTRTFLDKLVAGEVVTGFANRFRCKKGKYIYLSWNASPDLKTEKIYGLAKDVTELLKEKSQLMRQQEMLESMSKQARIGAWELNLETNRLTWSEMTKAIHQVPKDYSPMLESALSFYKPGKSRTTIEHAMQLAMEQGLEFSEELQVRTERGADVWVCATGKPVFQDGRCVRVYGSFQDINARKLIEENMAHTRVELEYQMRMLRAISQLQSSFIEQKDVRETLSPFLRALLDLSGSQYGFIAEIIYRESGPVLKVWSCSVVPDGETKPGECSAPELSLNKFERFFVDGTLYLNPVIENFVPEDSVYQQLYFGQGSLDSLLVFPVGSVDQGIALVMLGNSARGYAGEDINYLSPVMASVAQYVAGVRGVKAREQAEKDLISAKDHAEAAARAKSEFLAIMSHEIRTPLNGIMGMLNLLSRSSLNDEQYRKLKIAISSSETLLTIINDILDFSKVDANKITLEEIQFNLNHQLNEFAESMVMRAQEKKIELILDQRQVTEPMVLGDPGRLRQILTNLVGNAIKFTERGEVIILCKLSFEGDKANLEVSVSDTGIGIPEDKLLDLFDPFTQVDASTTRNYGGTGLGLAISKKLCEQMGGGISASSQLGRGTEIRFNVLLERNKNQRPELDFSPPELAGKRIILVEDNHANAQFVSQLLERWQAEVIIFNSGPEALNYFSAGDRCSQGELILVDQHMPEMNGDEFIGALNERMDASKNAYIVLSRISEYDTNKFSAAGFSGYVSKPINEAGLAKCINSVLSGATGPSQVSTLRQPDNLKVPFIDKASGREAPRILLVEDNPVNQDVAKMMLSDTGLVVDVVGNGLEALSALKGARENDHYSLVLMDCQMPEMDGYEATRQIRAGASGSGYSEIPIVAMTANAMKGDRDKCFDAGMSDYISKPIDPDLLEIKIRKWLVAIEPQEYGDQEQQLLVAASETSHDNWDKDALIRTLKGREDRARILLKSFSSRIPKVMDDFNIAVEKSDRESISFLAHSIKGSAGQVGGKELQRVSAQLELAANQGGNLDSLCSEFYSESERLLKAIQSYLDKE